MMDDDSLVGFYPPSLGSMRCDVLKKIGELENASMFIKKDEQDLMRPLSEEELSASNGDSGLDAIKNAMTP